MQTASCNTLRRHLEEAALTDPLPEAMTAHLGRCETCRSEWRKLDQTYHLLEDYAQRRGDISPDPVAQQALFRRLRQEGRSQRPVFAGMRIGYRVAVPLAAGAVLLAGWGITRLRTHAPSRIASNSPSPSSSTAPMRSDSSTSVNGSQAIASNTAPLFVNPLKRAIASTQPTEALGTVHSRPHPMAFISREGGSHLRIETSPSKNPKAGTALLIRKGQGEVSPSHPVTDDLAYINNAIPSLISPEAQRKIASETRQGDDFITVPMPQIAANDTPATRRIVGEAVKQYEDEKAVVDPRLFQKVDLEMKGGDLKELVETLTQKSGVRYYVAKDLEDVKLTVLVKQVPARDIMRQVVRLFNLQWRRKGEEGKYSYELVQDLKQKLAEEELKRKDNDQMLLNVVDEMGPYVQYKDTPKDQLKSLAEDAKQKMASAGSVEEREKWRDRALMFNNLTSDRYRAAVSYFAGLTPDQLVSLGNGGRLSTQFNATDSSLPPDSARLIQQEMLKDAQGDFGRSLLARPVEGVDVDIQFFLDRQQPDQVSLVASPRVVERGTHRGINSRDEMANGEPDRLRNPDNNAAHAALQSRPEYRQKTSLAPDSSSSSQAKENPNTQLVIQSINKDGISNLSTDGKNWIDSADFLEELHRKTGRNIVSDYYTRVYPKDTFISQGTTLIASLNNAADLLKSEWTDDGGFLRFRRFNYYSEREMDVPNRLLHRLKASRDARGYLNLDDLAEAATLSYPVLEHQELSLALLLKYGFDEIPLARNAKADLLLYEKLDPSQRRQAQSPEGIAVSDLLKTGGEEVRQALFLVKDLSDDQLAHGRYHIHLREPGAYEWFDEQKPGRTTFFPFHADVREPTREKAVAAMSQTLKARGETPQEIQDHQRLLFGPGAGIWSQVEFGDRYIFQETGAMGMHNGDGSFSHLNDGHSREGGQH